MRKLAQDYEERPSAIKECRVIEIDEMWHFVQKKREKIWVWLAVDRDSKELLGYEVGSRGKKTLKKLLRTIAHIRCDTYASDSWKVYKNVIPQQKLIQSKKETTQVESKNSQLRHYIARFHRKIFCYSKTKHMLLYTLSLFLHRKTIITSLC